jgi:hypothetical protein
MYTIAYDATLRRPGCVIIQAAYGTDADISLFPTESWLLMPSQDMKVYKVTEEQLKKLVEMSHG